MTTPTPDQSRPDAAEMTTARTVIYRKLWDRFGDPDLTDQFAEEDMGGEADAILSALRDAELVVVRREDVEEAIDAMGYVMDTYFWEKWGYQENYDRLLAALAARQGEDTDGR